MIIVNLLNIFKVNNIIILILVDLKKIFTLFVVALLILNSAGYVVVYFQLKSTFKKDARQKLENFFKKEDLTTIVLSKYEFENENENFHFVEPHEIKYYGKMYDVSKIEHSKDSVIITALSDEKEDNLNSLFAQLFSRNLNDKYSKTASILKLIITDAGLPIEFNGISSWREDICFTFIFVPLLEKFFDIPSPPPKYFSLLHY